MTNDDEHLGSVLRAYRERAGLTRDQLAARSRVSAANIRWIETGKHAGSVAVLSALVQALDLGATDAHRLLLAAGRRPGAA